MDNNLKLVRRSNWIVVMAALGFTGYASYRVYHSSSVARKRAKISRFLAAFSSAADAFSDSADCFATISRDFKEFLHSDSDQIPHSLNRIAKLAGSDEVSDSITRVSQALTLGVLRGYDQSRRPAAHGSSDFADVIMAKMCSESGRGLVSAVVGSFARNLVMAYFSMEPSKSGSFAKWIGAVACDEKSRDLIGELIQLFISSAVSVYLEKTREINTFDQIFSGLANPNHKREMRELLVSLSKGAVATLVKTSHQVLSGHGNRAIEPGPGPEKKVEEFEDAELGLKPRSQFVKRPRNGWCATSKVTSGSKKAIVDLTGRMTFAMMRSFVKVLLEKIYERMKRCVDIVNEEVIQRGLEIVRYAVSKTSAIASVCLSLCFHVLDNTSSFFLVL